MAHPVRLLQFTDLHLYGAAGGALRGVVTWPALEAAVAHALAHHSPWDGLLVTGDLVQDDPAGYARVRELFGDSDVPVYCVPGNHDVPPAMRDALAEPPFQVCGTALLGRWQLVLLDSYLQGSANGRLTGDELERLDAALAMHPDRHALVCLHHHPVPMGSRWLDRVGLENPQELFAVLDRYPHVRALLWGHVHQTYEGRRQFVRLLATPSTCAQFAPGSDGFAIDPRPPAYRWLDLHDDGRVETGVEWVEAATQASAARASAG
jgi:Icc protein